MCVCVCGCGCGCVCVRTCACVRACLRVCLRVRSRVFVHLSDQSANGGLVAEAVFRDDHRVTLPYSRERQNPTRVVAHPMSTKDPSTWIPSLASFVKHALALLSQAK